MTDATITRQLVNIPRGRGPRLFSQANEPHLAKWGAAGEEGFQSVPHALFRAQKYLELDSTALVVLLNLSVPWRGSSRPPSPAIIAKRMGVSKRTVERRLRKLEKRGFLKRLGVSVPEDGKPQFQGFELTGLVEKLATTTLIKADDPRSEPGWSGPQA